MPPKIILQRDLAKMPEATYNSETVDFRGVGRSKSTSGHRITVYTKFNQNKKCGGVNLREFWSICCGMPQGC